MGLNRSPEDVANIALGQFQMPESDYGDVAGVIDLRDPRSQISGRGVSGISPAGVESMEPGPAQDAARRRLQRMQGAVDIPGFLKGA